MRETQNGDVRRRDHIRGLLSDADNPRHDQARRVMESYEKEWLADQRVLLAILHCVGLFDRPASEDCLSALRAKPAIPGLTDALVDLTDDECRCAVTRLREVRLLTPIDPSDPGALDAHPLVREWFSERLKIANEAAWKEAHSRLYDHLRDTTHEGSAPALTDLAPLYHAIAHGCRAGRYQEALDEMYKERICCRRSDGVLEFYASKKLGAVGSNLAAISWFFSRPYETPVGALTPSDGAWVMNEASFYLRAQGSGPGGAAGDARGPTHVGRAPAMEKRGDRRVKSQPNGAARWRNRHRLANGGKSRWACGSRRRHRSDDDQPHDPR